MPSFPQSLFPTVESVMDLARSIVNDMFPGIGGTNGRILTDDAPFTLPYLNSAFRTLQRKLRNEGVTFEIKDNILLLNLVPVVNQNPDVQVSVSYNGYNNGTISYPTPILPSDALQIYAVWERQTGSGLPFAPMVQPQEGLPSIFQGAQMGMWEVRNYALYMVGSTVATDLRIRYKSGQPPLDIPPADFPTTKINILDSEEALAYMVASKYGTARGADVSALDAMATDAISDMVEEYVRRQQTVRYSRIAYGSGGSSDDSSTGQTNWGS